MLRFLVPLVTSVLMFACSGDDAGGSGTNQARIVATADSAPPIVHAPSRPRGTADTAGAALLPPELRLDEVEIPDLPAQDFADDAFVLPDVSQLIPEQRTGALEGSGSDVLGLIQDLEVDSVGRIVVADGRMLELKLFDRDGGFVARAGRGGRGPGEYRSIETVFLSRSGELLVADAGNRRILRYTLADSAIVVSGETSLPLLPFDVCEIAGRTFVASAHEGRVIHEISGAGALEKSFGGMAAVEGLPPSWASSFAETLSTGKLVCSEAERLLVFIPRSIPEIRAFNLDGTLRWRSTLPDWSQMGMEMVARSRPTARMTLDPRTNATSHSVAATLLPPGRLIVQVALDKLTYTMDEAPITTYVISLRDGRLVSRSGGLPRIARVIPPFLYVYSNDPYPTFSVLRSDTLQALTGGR